MQNDHIAPIVITGGAALAAIIALSRTKPSINLTPSNYDFTDETITARFVASIPEITPELNLELATATQVETFSQSSRYMMWGFINLGTSTAQIRVPVTYRYHIRLREPWRLQMQSKRIVVHSPTFRPSLPPAIHTDLLEKLSVRGWARGSTDELMEQTQREITPTLNQYAADDRHLSLVKHQCRQSVAEFVKLWLEREGRWNHRGFTEIEVRFPEEKEKLPEPTIKLLQ